MKNPQQHQERGGRESSPVGLQTAILLDDIQQAKVTLNGIGRRNQGENDRKR